MEAAHVKDALAVLRVIENPRDVVSWFRVLQLLDGVGPAGAQKMMAELGVIGDATIGPLLRLLEERPTVPAPARVELEALRETVRDCVGDTVPPAGQVERVRRFLEPILRRRYDDAEPRLRDLEQLEQLATGFPTRERFVTDLTLDPPTSTADLAGSPLLDEDYLVLSTIHSAKGGEWDVVHVIHAADGMIPSDMATGDDERIEEERRLFYVALTRARDALHVYFPLRYHRRNRGLEDKHWYAQLTRFLPREVCEHFELRTTCADGGSPEEGLEPTTQGSIDRVDALLAGLFDG
jgi:DNA helicase-2/ATP-dependent DNA helicase PcrA